MSMRWHVRFRNYGTPREQEFDNAADAASAIVSNDSYIENLDVDVDEALDECYGRIEINGDTYWASRILRELNEDSYYEFRSAEQNSVAENNQDYVEDTLDRMDNGDEESFEGGIVVTCIEEDDEDEDDEDPQAEGFYEIFDYVG